MNISGTWYNELGSKMELSVSKNVITGTYGTNVGSCLGIYPLTGYLNASNSEGIAVGWTVLWNNEHGNQKSLTSWAGQCQLIDGKEEELYAFWLLVRESDPAADWAATNIGQDTFTRNKPTEDMILSAKKRGKISHPTQCAVGQKDC